MHDVIILAGGFGTRIQSVSNGIAKPLLPIGDKVFLDYVLDWVIKYNKIRVILSLHNKSGQFLSYLKRKNFQIEIIPVIEPSPMGTGGAIKYILNNQNISDTFCVINGDTYVDFNHQAMIDNFNNLKLNAMIGLSYVNDTTRYGIVSFNKNTSQALSFKSGSNMAGWINNGCYIFRKNLFNGYDDKFSIEKDFFPVLVKEEKLFVYLTNGKFIDIGIPEDYEKFLDYKGLYKWK